MSDVDEIFGTHLRAGPSASVSSESDADFYSGMAGFWYGRSMIQYAQDRFAAMVKLCEGTLEYWLENLGANKILCPARCYAFVLRKRQSS